MWGKRMERQLVLTYVGMIQNLHYSYFPEQLKSKTEGHVRTTCSPRASPTEALLGIFFQKDDGQGNETGQWSAPSVPSPEG